MPSLILDDLLIWFAHCPKAGGTSVERFMVDRWGSAVGHLHWGWDRWWHGGGWRSANPPCSPQHLIWEDAAKTLARPPDRVFAVVRNPLSRIVSEYRYQKDRRRGTFLGRMLGRLPFSVWLRLMLGLAGRNPYCFDNHLRPQGDFVPQNARVFRLEDGLGPVTGWLGQFDDTTPSDEGPPWVLGAARSSTVQLCSADIRLLRARFGDDFRRFGYKLPDPVRFPVRRTAAFSGLIALVLLPLVDALERCGKL